jgi:Uma2 family endonuclease
MEPAYKLLNVEEFLDACPNDRRHYQLFDGVIVAMAPPGFPHQIIAAGLTAEIVLAVRAHLPRCSVHSQAGIAPRGVSGPGSLRNRHHRNLRAAVGELPRYHLHTLADRRGAVAVHRSR